MRGQMLKTDLGLCLEATKGPQDDFKISKVKLSGSKLVCPCADSLNPDSLCEMATA